MSKKGILGRIGRTPLVELEHFSRPGLKIMAKLESKNPGGSIKDRVALAMIEKALKEGSLTPGKTVIEATSGNTGIGLAMVCAAMNIPITILMPSSASEERRRIMAAYGAHIRLTPGHLGTDGAIEEAYRLAREMPDKYLLMDQFNNPASIEAHYNGTGLEIWEESARQVTHVVCTLGTSGTAMGLAKRMHEMNPDIKVIAVEPNHGHKIQGLKNMKESYPPGIYNPKMLDAVIHVADEDAFAMCRTLSLQEGIFVGMSSGAALVGALAISKDLSEGFIVVIFPDGGERYLSTPLYAVDDRLVSMVERKDFAAFAPLESEVELEATPAASADLAQAFDSARYPQKILLKSLGSRDVSLDLKERHGLFAFGPAMDKIEDLETWRRIIFLDILGRSMPHGQSSLIVGLADLDDRTLRASREAGSSREEFAENALGRIRKIAENLNISPQIDFISAWSKQERALAIADFFLERGLAYEKLRSVYFDVVKDANYGLGEGPELKPILGKTVDDSGYLKDDPKDFTLLKRVSLQDLKAGDFIPTKWGNVRPSWFLQMASCALDLTYAKFDLSIVMCGQNQIFPHLFNLKAILEHGAGVVPKAWLICGQVRRKGEPKAPSLKELSGSFVHPLALRLWLLSTSYHKPLVFAKDIPKMWNRNWRRIQETFHNLCLVKDGVPIPSSSADSSWRVPDLWTELRSAIEDDLGLSRFWPILFEVCREINIALREGLIDQNNAGDAIYELQSVDAVLGFLDRDNLPLSKSVWPKNVSDLIRAREESRKNEDFARADHIKDELARQGFWIEDTSFGPGLFRIPSFWTANENF